MNEKAKTYPPELVKGLAMRYALAREAGAIVKAAGETIRFLAPDEEGRESKLQKNQLDNVVAVAVEAECIEVITNFIRYQIGRREAWRYKDFGLRVIKDIEEEQGPVVQAAERVAAEVADRLREAEYEADEKELCREAHLELTRLYLGYLTRCFVYGDATGNWDDFHKVREVCQDV